jgi:hypothetical protein
MSQPHWGGKYPDFIVIKTAPNILEIGGIDGEWIDRSQTPYLEIAVELHGCTLNPTAEFEVGADGSVAEIWMLEKA